MRTRLILLWGLAAVSITIMVFILPGWMKTWSHVSEFNKRRVEHYESTSRNEPSKSRGSRVVVSMSSFPGRLERIRECIESLVVQSRKPDMIYVHVPLKIKRIETPATIPPLVDELKEKYPNILTFTYPEDYGPSTKLLGTLLVEKDAKTIVVTVDDDTVYHKDMLLALVDTAEKNPNAAPCFVWLCHGFGNAYAGIAYRVGFFSDQVFNYTAAPEGCKLHDDVYLSGTLYRGGIRPYVITPGFWSIIKETGHTSYSINKVKNTEKEYRDPCLHYFNFMQ